MTYTGQNILHHPIHSPPVGGTVVLPYATNPGTLATEVVTNNLMYLYPMLLYATTRPRTFSVHTTAGGGAGALLACGIYSDRQGVPQFLEYHNDLLGSPTALTAANTTITASITAANATLPPGRWWVGVAQQSVASAGATLNALPGTCLHGTVLPPDVNSALTLVPYVRYTMTIPGFDTIPVDATGLTTPQTGGAAGTNFAMVALSC